MVSYAQNISVILTLNLNLQVYVVVDVSLVPTTDHQTASSIHFEFIIVALS
jgi:hypothetical protein